MLPVLGKKAVLEWCMEEGLIGSSYVCPKCGKSMGKKERKRILVHLTLFKLWKESIEKQTSSLYVKNTGSKSGKTGGKIIYFYCHRNGFYNARGDMKRNMKIAGSNKINGNCPSKMKVYEDIESKVTVKFTKTHVGHGIDLGRMKITREEKEDIAKKLENKIPVEAILDDIRNSINQKLERIHLIKHGKI
ncbi:uncharacterized protein TNCV_1394191 [Trichonephila clavipes]|nr:uncharacterized protein TNCV_1394191 [Trichonephila clavipes]